MKLFTAGCGCSSAPNLYQGSAVKDLPHLGGSLVELSTDFEAWVTSYKCFSCGQLWQELYEAHGDRTSVVYGKSVSVRLDIGGSRILNINYAELTADGNTL